MPKLTTPEGFEFDGSPEEVIEIYRKLIGSEEDMTKAIEAALDRLPIPDGQKDLYRALYHAGDKGLPQNALVNEMRRSAAELAGVLGALGNRINRTPSMPGKPGVLLLFEITQINGVYHYKLRPEFYQILKSRNYPWLR